MDFNIDCSRSLLSIPLLVGAGMFVASCSDDTSDAPTNVSEHDLERICRATIAAIMGREIETISPYKRETGVSYVSYVRPNDKTLWKNRCKLMGNRVIWGSVDASGPGTGLGRWRDDPKDEVVTFDINGLEVLIVQKFSDGSKSSDSFTVK